MITTRKLFNFALNLPRRLLSAIPAKAHYCCMCGNHVLAFLPFRGWRSTPPLMMALGVVGSDVIQFSCPRCDCHDRERHLLLYLRKLGIFDTFKGASILHFAPEKKLSKVIEACGPAKYVQGDLYPSNNRIEKIDMLNIPYESQSFDFVIANHVLEHVADDLSALKELHRVCKVGGAAILQTPFSSKLVSMIADPGVDSDSARLHLYGQEDHVRLYGRDIFERFASVGFEQEIACHRDVLADSDAHVFGVNVDEPLFLFRRTA